MNGFLIISFTIVGLLGLTAIWYWADDNDYFQSNYNDLTEKQRATFTWQDADNGDKLTERFRQHFFDTDLYFPRQKVTKVKLFKNIPMLGVFTAKTLKQNKVDNFVQFCNDTSNYEWGETTWALSESEYYFRLYNSANKVIGKIYFCLDGCRMTDSRPFNPAMKFGMLSSTGLDKINTLINNKDSWE
jgi:hypothetical protein